ncbi:MAG: sulfite exporter TauE/SafE family protein [Segetibacter sp.]|nr:sulfite exporter TauE/SafE family protein [Segetibacter sp.]
MFESVWLFYSLLFLVAFFYASVGHGGASGYLALMAIFSLAPEVMKPTALLLNIFVSFIAFIQFYRSKHFIWKLFLPLALASIPMAFIGGLVVVEGEIYKKILAVLLLVPIARFLFFKSEEVVATKPFKLVPLLIIGSFIGLLSGMIGIGGGIILSPILLMQKWADQKQTAAVCALIIFVNSVAGLGGQLTKGVYFSTDMYWYVIITCVGGFCGAYFGALKFRQTILKNILASVLIVAVYKLLFTHA